MTYILGVGDRHFDNLLITEQGHLFHVDFGYILGRDPKPYPPLLKLAKEMVDAMGGISSTHYQQFKECCFAAFIILRKHSNLILTLFSLMIDSSIQDIALDPPKVLCKVKTELFRSTINFIWIKMISKLFFTLTSC
jgi:phosphatidylinositol 3-kinase